MSSRSGNVTVAGTQFRIPGGGAAPHTGTQLKAQTVVHWGGCALGATLTSGTQYCGSSAHQPCSGAASSKRLGYFDLANLRRFLQDHCVLLIWDRRVPKMPRAGKSFKNNMEFGSAVSRASWGGRNSGGSSSCPAKTVKVVCPDLAIPSPEETNPLPTRTGLMLIDTRGRRHDSDVFSLNSTYGGTRPFHPNQPQSFPVRALVTSSEVNPSAISFVQTRARDQLSSP